MASAAAAPTDKLSAALDLMMRMPPNNMRNNLAFILQLAPDIAADLLDVVDQPLEVATCPDSGNEYILCEFNRDEDSYRSPWSNKYHPALPDGRMPPDNLRELEVVANELFRSYRDAYYGGGSSSVYAFSTEGGFAVAVLIKKTAASGHRGVENGLWDSIHVVDVSQAAEPGSFTYTIVSTIILSVITENGSIDLSGSLTKRDSKTLKLNAVEKGREHIVNVGNVVQDMEKSMFSQLETIYFGKTKDTTSMLRRRDLAPAFQGTMMSELAGKLKHRGASSSGDDE